jgi:hypothetical protein
MFGWYSVIQATKELGKTRPMVWNWIEKRELPRRSMALASVLLLTTLAFVSACSSSQATTPPSASTVPSNGHAVALGTNNPAQGDCTTNTSEATTSVGSVVLSLTASSFQADIQLQSGFPNMDYGIFMQQVPGSCPQPAANAGTLTIDSSGHGQASASVPLVPGATTFYVQLVPGGAGAPSYTSDRISSAP